MGCIYFTGKANARGAFTLLKAGRFAADSLLIVSPRILIAENDCDARGQLAGWLEQAGFICAQTDASEALTEARRNPPDAAIVGVAVPDNGGMWVLRNLLSQADHVGVVVVSTPADLEVAVAAGRLGAIDCLPWPTSQGGVVEAVQRAVEWRASTRSADHAMHRLQEEVAFGREHLKETIRKVDPETAPAVLMAVLEARTQETHDHSQRVARAAVALAEALKLEPEEVQNVRRAAMLHDIGKIAVPERLLSSTAPLTDAALHVLRSHVGIAKDVLSTVAHLALAAEMVGATHEWFDGTGYPAGLHGAGIPLGARIISVADAYDAMISRRGWNDPKSHDEATADIVRGAGSQFDPDVVRAWIRIAEAARCS
jgi:putative nucleotidyltransferase with HDIG domain